MNEINEMYKRQIIAELGGAFSQRPVANYCAGNGICYAIRDACVRLDDDGWHELGRILSKEQYAKAREMRGMSPEDFKNRTEDYVADTNNRIGTDVKKWVGAVTKVPEYVH